MLSSLCQVFKTVFFIIIGNDYLRRNYPDKYNAFIITTSYNAIYLFSKCQIFAHKANNRLTEFTSNSPIIKQIVDTIYKKPIVRNELYKINELGETNVNYFDDSSFKYNMAYTYIFADNENKTDEGCVNMMMLHTHPFSTIYDISDVRFLLIEVKINDNTYKIDLQTEKYNYYLVNNVLDKNFFVYFLKHYHIQDLSQDNIVILNNLDKVDIKLIDNNVHVKEFEITDDKIITIKKDEYIYSGL